MLTRKLSKILSLGCAFSAYHVAIVIFFAMVGLTSEAQTRLLPLDCDAQIEPHSSQQQSDWQIFCHQVLRENLAWPPEATLTRIYEAKPDQRLLTTLIPFGRSPERFFTDWDSPRALIFWQDRTETSFVIKNQPRVLLGYTPKLHQLEVISLNMNTGENEFRVIHDFDGHSQPRVELKNKHECALAESTFANYVLDERYRSPKMG